MEENWFWIWPHASQTADPGVAKKIMAQSHTFVEIDHEIFSTVILWCLFFKSSKVVNKKYSQAYQENQSKWYLSLIRELGDKSTFYSRDIGKR